MTKWNEIQAQAKKLIDEGMHALKSGFTEAEFLAGTTASAAKLHMDAGRRRFEMYRVLHDLGAVLYNAIASRPDATGIELTPAMRSLIDNAHKLDEILAEDEHRLGRFSVVRKADAASPKPARKKPGAQRNVPLPQRKKRVSESRTTARHVRRGR